MPRFEVNYRFNRVKAGEVDVEYYVENQVKPAAMRVLELFGVLDYHQTQKERDSKTLGCGRQGDKSVALNLSHWNGYECSLEADDFHR